MSLITNLLIHVMALDDEEDKLAAVARYFTDHARGAPKPPVSVNDPRLPNMWYGGTKGFEATVLVGGYNFLELDEFVAYLRGLAWGKGDVVQVMAQGGGDGCFRLIDIIESERSDPAESAVEAAKRAWEAAGEAMAITSRLNRPEEVIPPGAGAGDEPGPHPLVGSWRVAAEQRPGPKPKNAFWPNVYSFFADGLALATDADGATRHGAWRAWEDGAVYAQFWSNRIPPPAEPPISLGLWDWEIAGDELRSRGRPLLRRINAEEWPRPGRAGVKGLRRHAEPTDDRGQAGREKKGDSGDDRTGP